MQTQMFYQHQMSMPNYAKYGYFTIWALLWLSPEKKSIFSILFLFFYVLLLAAPIGIRFRYTVCILEKSTKKAQSIVTILCASLWIRAAYLICISARVKYFSASRPCWLFGNFCLSCS